MNAKIRFSFAAALFLCLAATLAQAEVVDIGNDQLKALFKQGTPVVDLRTAGEWRQTGVVKGSQMITLFDEQGRALAQPLQVPIVLQPPFAAAALVQQEK